MLATLNSPSAVLARLRPAPATVRTIVIVEGDLVTETQLGFSWPDALEALWEGQQVYPLRALDVDFAGLAMTDVTAALAMQLSARTYTDGRTPEHLEPLFHALGMPFFDADAPRRDVNAAMRLGGRQLGVVS